ncbi:MAG TPA: alginate export family protein, partial [Candidatus Hydrogenedentes bacterium]|nr:alginate export family protein [Candidatus Hydrogenedentota bacterium]
MKKSMALLLVAVTVALAVPAFAELQNVVVGGEIRIRGNWYDFDNDANALALTEQRTRLSVRADFTDNVSAFIELDEYSIWGEETRSDYLTGLDSRPQGDVAVHQAYIEAKEMWGTALKARIGRQEIKLGGSMLVGANESAPFFTGLSFDALRLSYVTDQFSVDAIMAKVAENSPV